MSTDTTNTSNTTSRNKKRKTVLAGITLLFIAAGIAYAAYYHIVLSKIQETDNAYVGGNLVNLSSQVTGNVAEIRADETQMVQAGATLVRLDSADADIALTQADARWARPCASSASATPTSRSTTPPWRCASWN
jgi:membrane fusion protein (multidrug efflux system)